MSNQALHGLKFIFSMFTQRSDTTTRFGAMNRNLPSPHLSVFTNTIDIWKEKKRKLSCDLERIAESVVQSRIPQFVEKMTSH